MSEFSNHYWQTDDPAVDVPDAPPIPWQGSPGFHSRSEPAEPGNQAIEYNTQLIELSGFNSYQEPGSLHIAHEQSYLPTPPLPTPSQIYDNITWQPVESSLSTSIPNFGYWPYVNHSWNIPSAANTSWHDLLYHFGEDGTSHGHFPMINGFYYGWDENYHHYPNPASGQVQLNCLDIFTPPNVPIGLPSFYETDSAAEEPHRFKLSSLENESCECLICGEIFENSCKAKDHATGHMKIFSCLYAPQCDLRFAENKKLQKHMAECRFGPTYT
ncbi:hypothetical protein M422DRAFT_23548 [Sphaerobolus stellatus SS14]|nr:hypothetical protein M422DRAFT_23548 [Sphaerobolus stellatus SS14]